MRLMSSATTFCIIFGITFFTLLLLYVGGDILLVHGLGWRNWGGEYFLWAKFIVAIMAFAMVFERTLLHSWLAIMIASILAAGFLMLAWICLFLQIHTSLGGSL